MTFRLDGTSERKVSSSNLQACKLLGPVQRRGSTTKATPITVPGGSSPNDCAGCATGRGVEGALAAAEATACKHSSVVTHYNFRAHSHRPGECLAHPSGRGCDCETVQMPTMDAAAAWQVLAKRFQVVHPPAVLQQGDSYSEEEPEISLTRLHVCAPPSAGANAPLDRQQSDPSPRRASQARTSPPRDGVGSTANALRVVRFPSLA